MIEDEFIRTTDWYCEAVYNKEQNTITLTMILKCHNPLIELYRETVGPFLSTDEGRLQMGLALESVQQRWQEKLDAGFDVTITN